MSDAILVFLAAAAAVIVALRSWCWADNRSERGVWQRLIARQPATPGTFNVSMVSALPVPARRFFEFAIAPGTPLHTIAQITMHGEFSLGDRDNPGYMPMRAEQLLAAPHGFIWRVRTGGRIWFTGSDGAMDRTSWSRVWLYGIVPVARAGNNADHRLSALGRCVAEAVFWTPAALLPGDGISWEAIDESSARVVVSHDELEQAVDITVDAEGRVLKVVFQRWSNANSAKTFQFQPFGGYLSDYRTFQGYRLPTRVEAGNFFGTDNYFAFFKATVTAVRFPLTSGTLE
jgi:hypothetical protein